MPKPLRPELRSIAVHRAARQRSTHLRRCSIARRFHSIPNCHRWTRTAIALIDESRCIGCALCLPACPVDAIVGASGHMHTVIAEHCTGCELCIPACPVDCIAIETVKIARNTRRCRTRKRIAPSVRSTHPARRRTSTRGRGASSATPVTHRRATQLGRRVIRPRTTSAVTTIVFDRADSGAVVQIDALGHRHGHEHHVAR